MPPGQCFHLLCSVVLMLCILTSDFELPPPGESSYWQTSGQACCSLQTGDSSSSHMVRQLFLAWPLYHTYQCPLPLDRCPCPFLLSVCLSSAPCCLLHPHTLKILLTVQSLPLCLFVFIILSLYLATIIICNKRFHICLLL